MGLAGGLSGPERVGPPGSARSSRIGFFRIYFQCENNSNKHQKMFLEHEKLQKFQENS
jgi:hypothetical protein